jgi:hypothetical protein
MAANETIIFIWSANRDLPRPLQEVGPVLAQGRQLFLFEKKKRSTAGELGTDKAGIPRAWQITQCMS